MKEEEILHQGEPFNVSIAAGSHEEARRIAEHMLDNPVISEPLAELPPKWSRMLSGPSCSCKAAPGTQHLESCPRWGYVLAPELPVLLPPKDRDLYRLIPIPEEANLGLATTEQLLNELRVRGEVESVNVYQTAGRELAEEAKRLLAELPPAMKAYRTVDPN